MNARADVTCGLTIRRAQTAADVDAVLRGRHRVYAEEHEYFSPTPDARIYDRFDTYQRSTLHLVAEIDGSIIGGVRYCVRESSVGLPVDEFFDFAPYLRLHDRSTCGGMMFVTKAAEGRGVATKLIQDGERWAISRAASVMLGTVNPSVAPLFRRLGYEAVARPDRHASGLPFVPMLKRLSGERTVTEEGTGIR